MSEIGNAPIPHDKALPEGQAACFQRVHPGLHKSILANMRKLSFKSTATSKSSQGFGDSGNPREPSPIASSQAGADVHEKDMMLKMMEIGGTQHHFTRNGRLVANKQLIYKIDKEKGMTSVSNIFILFFTIGKELRKY